MAKAAMNLQDSFLNQVRKDNAEIKLVLLDGTVLTGVVRGFDSFTVIVSAKGSQHLVYKHAIGQIITNRFSVRRDDEGQEVENARDSRPAPAEVDPRRRERQTFNTLNLSQVVVSEEVHT